MEFELKVCVALTARVGSRYRTFNVGGSFFVTTCAYSTADAGDAVITRIALACDKGNAGLEGTVDSGVVMGLHTMIGISAE